MKKAIAIFVAVLFVFAMASFSFAAEEKAAPAPMEKKAEPAKSMEKPKVDHIIGEVKAVDMKAMTVTVTKMVNGKAEESVVTVSDNTVVMMGKEKKALADMKAGDKVTVVYTEVKGKNVAMNIVIHKAIKKVEPAKTMEKPAKPTEKK